MAAWVMRVVNGQKPETVQSLQVRGFALCLLPAARKASVLMTQQSKLLHVSGQFGLPSGFASATGRQACPQGWLVISGGFGLDPEYRGAGVTAPGAKLSRPERMERQGDQRHAGHRARPNARAYAFAWAPKRSRYPRRSEVYFVGQDVTVKADNGTARQSVGCGGAGSYVLSGGSRTVKGRSANVEMQESFPDSPGSWTVAVTNRGDQKAGDAAVKLYAVCIKK